MDDEPRDELLAPLASRDATSGRHDDTADTIRHRIDVCHDQTLPLIEYDEGRDILVRVDGIGTIDEVTKRTNTLLHPLLP